MILESVKEDFQEILEADSEEFENLMKKISLREVLLKTFDLTFFNPPLLCNYFKSQLFSDSCDS